MNYLMLLLAGLAYSFEPNLELSLEEPPAFEGEDDAWWMADTEFVLVINSNQNAPLEHVLYLGPQGGLAKLGRTSVVVSESLMGSVQSGYVEVWRDNAFPRGIPESGIIFANRWLLATLIGRDIGASSDPLYASDVVGITSSRRQLHFIDNEVFAENHKICVGDTSLLRSCAEGETATPEEIVEHLRVQLTLVPGQHIAGADLQ